ncbi:ribosomal protein S12 methylthiotransferase accessory factor [Kibdelosporangium banguiense]|uniref:Ribosomal protein S12 methylthiotransferase accessory factor n=1 Tax=Kibdelosporangium banguiense TaxID=1365924 RepID=A0ABS4TN20_9PSEU|nr:TOMM precursor leader peptide-binding protein [Kibdelosporangium banguiense]MBP2325797.1 ribosomal protein S12 methylthiotransferase accessory factor [Kibdelosporangium banguiense]
MTEPGVPAGRVVGFKRHLRVEVIKGEAVYLFSERGVTALKGSDAETLAPLLDNTRDLPALLRDVPSGVAPEQVGRFIARLDEAGLLTLGPPPATGADERARAYWEAAGTDATTAVASTAGRRVQVIATGSTDPVPALAALREAGLTVQVGPQPRDNDSRDGFALATDDPADLSVVLCDDYLSPDLADIDAVHRAARRPWLLAKLVGAQVWLGPVFDVPDLGCWHCLATRLWAHRDAEAHVQAALGRVGPAARPVASLPALDTMATHMMALEVTKWLAGYRYAGQRGVWTFDSLDLTGRHHEFRRRPQCALCGNPTHMRTQARRPVVLESQPKSSDNAGGHRSLPPQRVYDRYEHLISPVTGVIKEITQHERGPSFFNSFRAGHNVAVSRNLFSPHAAPRAENGGKGVTPLHGKVSAMCEALERHSGFFHGDEERVRGSYKSLRDQAVHPSTCQLFDQRQYPGRSAWNAAHSPFQHVPDPFDDNAVVDWTPVWSLTHERHRLLPTAMLYYGAPPESGSVSLYADSNGNAAGSSLEDAVLQGMLELVERDSVAMWWYNRVTRPQVDLTAFGDQWIDELKAVYAGLNREVWVLDVTADSKLPTMVALSRRTDGGCEDIMFGFGAHLDPRVALRRALTEMNQLMPVVVDGPEGRYGWAEREPVEWWQTATIANQPYLLPDRTIRARVPEDYGYEPTTDLLDDVETVRRRVESLGLEVLVLDQTRPDIGLPVVKVVVPGMRSFWARFGPGRLFDVPVALGWLPRPTEYADLNPIPLFI